jgi:hypothetical protein
VTSPVLFCSSKDQVEPKKGGSLETYIVRIYRHGRTIPHRLVGIVEKSGLEGKQAFTCLDELWDILNPPKGKRTPRNLQKESRGTKKSKPLTSQKIIPKKKGESHELQKKV